jgi:CRP-like cAMP-binding protein
LPKHDWINFLAVTFEASYRQIFFSFAKLIFIVKTKQKLHVDCATCKSRPNSHFACLGPEELETVNEHKSCIVYKKGQTIFYEGTRPMGLFCIHSGKIKVFKMGSQGKEQIIYLAKPGDFLGYRALLSEEFYAASATVLEEAQICFVPKNDFFETLQRNPKLYTNMMKAVCHELGIMEDKIAMLAQKSVRERLATTLIMLKETYGMEGDGSVLIDIALSREDLANIVGTATETVIRLLSEFKQDGLIALDKKKIRVLDARGLVQVADFYA